MKNIMYLLVFGILLSCGNAVDPNQKEFGESISDFTAISYDELLAVLSEKESFHGQVQGKVEEVCQVKGCWMKISSKNANHEPMMVKFKDYGFFMPLDLAGTEVIIQGTASQQETSVAELRHYMEDAGKSQEEIMAVNSPKREVHFIADGVKILN